MEQETCTAHAAGRNLRTLSFRKWAARTSPAAGDAIQRLAYHRIRLAGLSRWLDPMTDTCVAKRTLERPVRIQHPTPKP